MEDEPGHGLAFTIRDVLEQVCSIAGVLGGGSFGWLVEAWANDKCNMVLLEQLTDTKRVEDFRVFVAAGLAVGGPVKSGDKVASSILAGLHLLTGTDPSYGCHGSNGAAVERNPTGLGWRD